MKRFISWFKNRFEIDDDEPRAAPRRPVVRATIRPPRAKPVRPAPVEISSEFDGRIEDGGPGKNVLVRNKYLRDGSDSHDTLEIVDGAPPGLDDEDGIDPYNTGRFDRSKSWDSYRTRK